MVVNGEVYGLSEPLRIVKILQSVYEMSQKGNFAFLCKYILRHELDTIRDDTVWGFFRSDEP